MYKLLLLLFLIPNLVMAETWVCEQKYPNISIQLLISSDYQKTESFPVYRGQDWLDSEKFVTE